MNLKKLNEELNKTINQFKEEYDKKNLKSLCINESTSASVELAEIIDFIDDVHDIIHNDKYDTSEKTLLAIAQYLSKYNNRKFSVSYYEIKKILKQSEKEVKNRYEY